MRFLSLCCVGISAIVCRAEVPSFRNDVMPILARGGCNQGACHGNLNGKGGFRLSLRGENPALDHLTLTREMMGRRLDVNRPEQSLLLRKAAGLVPHEGGPRFGPASDEYQTLLKWIEMGAADDPQFATLKQLLVEPREKILIAPAGNFAIRVRGVYSDGSTRDLSNRAVFEPNTLGLVNVSPVGVVNKLRDGESTILVRYQNRQLPVSVAFIPTRAEFHPEPTKPRHPVDVHVFEQLNSLRLTASPMSSDSVFIRRAFLDTLGQIPEPDEVRRFLSDENPDKRKILIDRLVSRPEFADYWSQKWADLLRTEEKALDRKGVRVFHQWIRDAIARDMPLNQFAAEIVTARGSTYQNPAANFYRSLREPYARSESIAQVFLGIRLQCAKCHNHPFDAWTQDDYHEFAATFGQVDYRINGNNRKDKFDQHEFDGEQIVFMNRDLALKHPRTGKAMAPRLLGETSPLKPGADSLDRFADWLADQQNPYFARAQVNRVWYHLFGRGLVEPNDDLRLSNPPVNAPLLDELEMQFREGGFKLKPLVRLIMNSRTYQQSAIPGPTNDGDETHFSRAIVQPLEAEQLFDAVCQMLNQRPKFDGYPKGTKAMQMAAMPQDRRSRRAQQSERFLKTFGKPERLLTCECERSDDTGLMQAFQMLTGELLHEMLGEEDNRLGRLISQDKTDREIIDHFYLASVSRYPSPIERKKLEEYVAKLGDRRKALEDIIWGLVNSKEFLLRH
ncbi:DUF1549 and DUF1553 domain-containing protein [Zavarzinella formosa]|uniref:DUF1549 and DUF1553 domain-containing protein n=1 Tax=Zavarzinella formosa TaxID=360055 RepID=UPI0003094263|nr:DUF1549 and DUF1553 domain-containing protein [Zavarzinella formosa]